MPSTTLTISAAILLAALGSPILESRSASDDNSLPRFVPVLDVESDHRLHRILHSAPKRLDLGRFGCYCPDSMNEMLIVEPTPPSRHRRRFQRGSLQRRKSAGGWNWIAFWWQDHRRRGQILGPCPSMSRPEALPEMTTLLQPVNLHAGEQISLTWTDADWI